MAGNAVAVSDETTPGRVIGQVVGARPGPTLICTGGLHGNETAGVTALARVAPRLRQISPLAGDFLALAGNRAAAAARLRYIDSDLNRVWLPDRVRELRSRDPRELVHEDLEQRELIEHLDLAISAARGPVFLLDLHTTSGPSAPFAVLADTLGNRRLALKFPIPAILGVEEVLAGTLLDYITSEGLVAVGLEGGQHDDPGSADYLEALVWVALAAGGLLTSRVPEVARATQALKRATGHLPRALEVSNHHYIHPSDGFRMRTGFASFDRVEAGAILADDRRGPIRARESGRVLMPLYQAQGDDGFFLVREFRPLWLRVSAAMRGLQLDRIVHWLPGVARHPHDPDVVIVNQRIARWRALGIFHLLGFRRITHDGDLLHMRRRARPRSRR